jgi:hypothetical protein
MRFTGTGDVEVFDGRSWRPLASLMGDSGMREDLPSQPRSQPQSESDARGPRGGAVDGEQETPGLLA